MLKGNIPGVFAQPAGWGVILVGITALAVLLKGSIKGRISSKGILAVAIIGIIDFLVPLA
jgi:hypothetical protein